MPTFGETLRRERELRRIALREVAEATKINLRYLEALERDDFKYLPGGVHARNFVRAYARYVGVDETEMVNAYLYEVAQRGEAADAGPAPSTSESTVASLREHFQVDAGTDERRRRLARRSLIAIAALLVALALGALGFWVLSERPPAAPDPTPRSWPAP
ncbi:MAG: helix-turn-helix domain-containing protein [Acidobacteria bacterium]|nr:helix-turn-helix domain-containing protein [Acidobacteriota bacterium]